MLNIAYLMYNNLNSYKKLLRHKTDIYLLYRKECKGMDLVKKLSNLNTLKDHYLAWRAKEGDSKAFADLYIKYMGGIFRYVYFRVNQNRDISEDIVQETFLRSWKNMKYFDIKKGSFQAWIYAIARNLATDELKKNRRLIRLNPNITDVEGSLEDNMFKKSLQSSLLKEINKLTDIQKEVTVLRFIEEIPYSEISKITGKSEVALRAIQYRALNNLKKKLSKNK